MGKPRIKKFIPALYYSSRNNSPIRRIVLHYTTADTAQSTISWFTSENNDKRTSAHYIVDKNGDIYQMVEDGDAAHHCKGVNRDSIGIEHVAKSGERLTPAQEKATVQLIKWLISKYNIPLKNITGHRYTPGYTGGTDCPHSLFGERNEAAVKAWVTRNFS